LYLKEVVATYEKLEQESIPPKPRLQMLQNSIGDVNVLVYEKSFGDKDIAFGNLALHSENKKYGKNNANSTNRKPNVHITIVHVDYDILNNDVDVNER
jgi:hypothetical protein